MSESSFAAQMLEQISVFSRRVLRVLGFSTDGSPHGSVLPLQATGLVLHHTAGGSMEGTLRWMMDPQSGVSSHFVVGRQWPDVWWKRLVDDLPLVQALPAPVVQMRPINLRAYHATWANRWAYGVELCNAGELQQSIAGWVAVADAKLPVMGQIAVAGRMFASYTRNQIQAALELCWALHQITPLAPEQVVSHDMVQGAQTRVTGALGHDKRDVGPLCLHAWRRCIMAANPTTGAMLAEEMQRSVPEGVENPAWLAAHSPEEGLHVLGYASPSAVSVEMFQVMMGIAHDGRMGPQTRAAVGRRLVDRFAPRTAAQSLT